MGEREVIVENRGLDEQIRARIVADDPEAIELIWEGYGNRLFGFLTTILRSHHDAEETLQDVFMKIVAQRRKLLKVKDLKPYFFTMARNAAISSLRRRGDTPVDPVELERLPAEPVVADDRAREVASALGLLPEDQREVVILKIYEEMTFEEIGRTVGVSPNTAASRYRYALEKLEAVLRRVLS